MWRGKRPSEAERRADDVQPWVVETSRRNRGRCTAHFPAYLEVLGDHAVLFLTGEEKTPSLRDYAELMKSKTNAGDHRTGV